MNKYLSHTPRYARNKRCMANFRLFIISTLLPFILGFSFRDAIEAITQHSATKSLQEMAQAQHHQGMKSGSWGDPVAKVSGKNLPFSYLDGTRTPMTGVEFGISQKIPLTSRYRLITESFNLSQQTSLKQAEDKKRVLLTMLWQILITEKKLSTEKKILQENRTWLHKILNIAEKLYTNGKATHRNLLDIQMREAEIVVAMNNRDHEIKEQRAKSKYLTGIDTEINPASIPWHLLTTQHTGLPRDFKEQVLQSTVQTKAKMSAARQLAFIPDITLTAGYHHDGQGNFLSLTVSLPLPVSKTRSAEQAQALSEERQAKLILADYQKFKSSELIVLQHKLQKITTELKILTENILHFAKNSHRLAFTSYRLGKSSYAELLQAELKLQNILLRQATLRSQLASTQVKQKYLRGEKLYE